MIKNHNFLLATFVSTVTNVTIVMELKGIKIAAIIGDSCPVTAK